MSSSRSEAEFGKIGGASVCHRQQQQQVALANRCHCLFVCACGRRETKAG